MDLPFYIDPETGEPRLYRYGVPQREAADVVARPLEDRPGHDSVCVVLPQMRAGQHLQVVYLPAPEPGSVFVITPFDLGPTALRALRPRRKRKS